jgi:enoyl-CoA hydratase
VESYLEEALKLAEEIALRAPLAVYAAKKMINQAFERTLAEGLAEEKQTFYNLFATEDQKEGMNAFAEKRKPEWKGK